VNGLSGKAKRQERLNLLEKLLTKLVNKADWNEADFAKHYYLFFSKDNENIVENFPKEFIYTEREIENL
jgi:hypothetical protein